MKRKRLFLFNIFMTIVILFGLIFSVQINVQEINLNKSDLLAENVDEKFNFVAIPDYQKKRAGETAEIKLRIKNIDMGDVGLNNVVGYLSYDEALFDEVNIEGIGDWHFERNQDKNHEMYGKFVIYNMSEGVTEGQDVADITLKIKEDVKPQRTEVKITNLQSSDGNEKVEVSDETAVIDILKALPKPPAQDQTDTEIPEEPVKADEAREVIVNNPTYSIKTGDDIMLLTAMLAVATIALNIMVIAKKKASTQGHTRMKLKVGITTAVVVIAICLVALAVTSFAHSDEITALINGLNHKERQLSSEKYFITDETVSRIAPHTYISSITDKFDTEISVYEKDSNQEVTDGIVKTGMRISDGKANYNAVVLGDVNEDGESDTVELTRIIRNIVNNNKYKFNSIEKLAGDMNVDNTIDMDDVDASTKYILYNELSIPGFNQIKNPKIEIVGGTFNENIDAYEDTVTVKVTAQDENASQTRYKIEGTTTKGYTVIESGDTFEISNNGVYKVSAYSYGVLGNRSEIPYEIIVKKSPTNKYKVTTRMENLDGTYDETTEEKTGRIGSTVNIGEEIPSGYQINQNESTLTGVIPEEGIIELVITLDRKLYTLTLEAGNYISSVKMGDESSTSTITKSFKYGKSVSISAVVEEIVGNKIAWSKWISDNPSAIGNQLIKDTEIRMPTSNIKLTATAMRDINEYAISYNLSGGQLVNGIANPELYTVETETFILNNPSRAGYRFKGWIGTGIDNTENPELTVPQETVTISQGSTGDRTYTAVWEIIEYAITYNLDGGRLVNGQTNPDKYTIETATFTLNKPVKTGYTFVGWVGTGIDNTENPELTNPQETVTINQGSTGDRAYTAVWQAKTGIAYKVEYYIEKVESTDKNNAENYTIKETENLSGTTNQEVNAEIRSYTGFKYDESNPNNTITGNIAGDGSLTLKVYYTRNSYTLALEKDENVDGVTGAGKYKFEQSINIDANLKTEAGYTITFVKWQSSTASSVGPDKLTDKTDKSANITMPAGDVTLTAISNKTANAVNYTVKYYYEENGEYPEQTADENKVTRQALTGATVSVTDEDKTTSKASYVFDDSKVENLSGVVAGDESLVLKVYFKQEFTVTYKPGTHGTFEVQTTEHLKYNSDTPAFSGEKTHSDGYEFAGWDKTVENKVTKTVEYVATWRAIEYTITYDKAGGNLAEGVTNPDKYTVETETFTLNNPSKEGYTFKGWVGTGIDNTENPELTVPQKTVTIEQGSTGNRAYTAVWQENTGVAYTVEYYLEKLDSTDKNNAENYTLKETDDLSGSTNQEVTAEIKTYAGFTYDSTITHNKVTGNIPTSGSLTLKVYYTRNSYTLTLEKDENVDGVTGAGTYKFEQSINIDANLKTEAGYTITFVKWQSSTASSVGPDKLTDKTDKSANITMPAGDVTLTAISNKTANAVNYTVKYYYEENGEYPEQTADENKVTRQALTGATVSVTDEDKTTSKASYVFDDSKVENLSGVVAGDESLVLKVYFKQEFTVTYKPGTHGTFEVQTTEHLKYNSDTPAFSGEKTHSDGYEFAGWDKTVENKVTKTVEYVATWRAIEYTITYDKAGGNLAEGVTNPDKYTVETETFTLNNPSKEGYTFKGWVGTGIDNTENPELTVPQKTVTIEQGSTGNRAYTAVWQENTGVAYTVEYYLEKLDSTDKNNAENYTLKETDDLSGSTNQEVTAEIKTYAGFTYDSTITHNKVTGNIPTSGSLALKVYYTRNSYTLTLEKDENVDSVIGAGKYKFEQSINIDANLKTEAGYTITFVKWQSSTASSDGPDKLIDKTDKSTNITMPAGDVTLTAISNKTADTVNYTVEYYYEEDGIYKNSTSLKSERTAKTGTSVEVTDSDKIPQIVDYVLDSSKTEAYTGTVSGDGSLVLKVYFKQDLTITYSKGTHGTFETQTTEHLAWGANTPAFEGELTHEEGYDFNGWNQVPTDKVTENKEYVATWKEHDYEITYTLAGGALAEGVTNPATYTISTDTFTLNNPTKTGYRFKGWTGTDLNAESTSVTVAKGRTGDRAYTANWEVINYNITYELNGGTLGFDGEGHAITNPTTYNVETPTFALNNPTKTGFTFLGWTGTNLSEETTYVTVETGNTEDRSYIANWRVNTGVEYKVRYYLENLDSANPANKSNYTLKIEDTKSGVTNEEVTAGIKEFTGFTYDENNSNNKITGNIAGDGSLVLEVYYTRNAYTLYLEKDDNVDGVTGGGIYKFEAPVTVNATLKTETGYTIAFVKWKSSTADSTNADQLDDQFEKNTSFTMPAGDVTLTAMSNKTADTVNYTVEFYYEQNGEYPEQVADENKETRQAVTGTTVNVTNEDKTTSEPTYLLDSTKNGNWSGVVTGDGNLVLKVYFKQEFTVTYKPGTKGTFDEQTTEHLAYNSDTPAFIGDKTHNAGYEFAGWDKNVDNKVTNTVEYVATWTTVEYTITYELNGGSLGENETTNEPITNPATYTVETNTFILNNPTKDGYTFKGWTGTGLDAESTRVTVVRGSTGNRSYTAVWEAIEYNITYNLNGGELVEGESNPSKYTIETPTFTLNNPSKTGYTFKGWTGTGIDNTENPELTVPQETVAVAQGSMGDRAYTAVWQENDGVAYTVEYYVEKIESASKYVSTNYTLKETKNLSGTTNQEVTAEIKDYTGFTYDSSLRFNNVTGNIQGNGSLVLKVYYTRNSYTLTMQKDENIQAVEGTTQTETTGNAVNAETLIGTFRYQEPIQISATAKTEAGYTITFSEWETECTEILQTEEAMKANPTSFTMPAEDVTVKATATKTANIVPYTVAYYYEGASGYAETPTYTDETRTATVGTTVEVTDGDKVPNSSNIGYVFDDGVDTPNVLTATVPSSGTAILKVYFKKATYTLNVVAGDKVTQIKLGEETASEGETLTGTYKYGDSITIDATVGTETGYTIAFGKWQSSSTALMADNTTKNLTFTMPNGDLTLTAVADITALDATYTVEYYYQVDGTYPATPGTGNIATRTGKTGEQAAITNADKEPITEGYVYDTEASNVESTDENGIKADGSTTLKVYFKQQFTVTFKPGEHGNFEIATVRNNDYNGAIPEFTGTPQGNDGYVFDSWKLTKIGDTEVTEETEIPTTVRANLEYTAQWRVMPQPSITHTPTTWTNQNVTVTITAPEGCEAYGMEYRIDDSTEWRAYENPFEAEQNCTIHARLVSGTNRGEAANHAIENIDKIAPAFAETPTYTAESTTAVVTANVTDNLSGVVEYGMRKQGYAGYASATCDSTLTAELTFEEVHETGTYEIYVKDVAGNTATTTIEVTIPVHNVAKIVLAPAGYESLVGTGYESLAEALEASDTAAQAGNIKIEIIDYIDNEENTIASGRNYTINLNNYFIKNQEAKPVFTVNGKLTILDENALGAGTVSSSYGVGIHVALNGELTVGADDGKISIFSPIIDGLTYGVEKEIDYEAEKVYDDVKDKYYYPEGILNFYDGKIMGKTAAFNMQRANDTPLMYDPSVQSNLVTGKQEATLAIGNEQEAVIGKKRYLLLEDAISDANRIIGDSDTQVEIKIVRDLAKDADHKIVVDETKNIKLDLNGHTFTTVEQDYVLKNYGKLEICDSSKVTNQETGEVTTEGTGKIIGTTENTIYNGISEEATDNLQYENIDLSAAVANDENYYFQARGNGEPGLISNNYGVRSTARSYIELDLTNRNGMFEIVADTSISAISNCYGYITVSNQSAKIEHNDTYGRKVHVIGSGSTNDNLYKFNLAGGEKYYIHIGYSKTGTSAGTTSDCFVIKSMKIAQITKAGNLRLTSGTIENSKVGTKTVYTSAIDNDSLLEVNGGKVVALQNYSTAITNGKNDESAFLKIEFGEVKSLTNAIENSNNGLIKISGGTIGTTGNSTTIAVDNGGYLYVTEDEVNIGNGSANAIVNKNRGCVKIDKGNFIGGNTIKNECSYNSYDSIVVNGGNYTATDNAIQNASNGNIKINNAVMLSAKTGIYNGGSGTIEINNVDMSKTDSSDNSTITSTGIYNNSNGKIILNGGKIYCLGNAVVNYAGGTIEINGGQIEVKKESSIAIRNLSRSGYGVIKIADGTIVSAGKAIENADSSDLIITGGNIETTGNYVCVDNTGYRSITIGTKDSTINKESPKIKSKTIAVRTGVGTVNFYDGVLVGQENNTIDGTLAEIEENSFLVKETRSDGLQYITLGTPTEYVAKIAQIYNPDVSSLDESCYKLENNNYYFTTLNYAVDACNNENATTVELMDDVYLSKKIMVNSNQDVTIEFNGKTMYPYVINNFENNGKLSFKNTNKTENTYGNVKQGSGQLVLNNEHATLEMDSIAINYTSTQGYTSISHTETYRKIIDNYGTLNINNSTMQANCINGSTILIRANGILNEVTGKVCMDNVSISGYMDYFIENNGVDAENEEIAMIISNSTISTSGYGIINRGKGTILVDNSTVTSSSGNFNYEAGNLIINNSIISKSISNKSNGTVLIKGADTQTSNITNEKKDGTLKIYGGTVKGSSVVINNSGTLLIYGGTIESTSNNVGAISNANGANAQISGINTKIMGNTGIQNAGEMIIKEAYIEGRTNAGVDNAGTLTLGNKEGNVTYVPVIYGKKIGVKNTGTFYFYDGIIDGPETASITGVIPSETEIGCIRVIHKGTDLAVFDDGTEDKYSIQSGREISVLQRVNVAHVDSKNEDYTTLVEAFAEAGITDTVRLIHDASISGLTESAEVEEGKNITLDLNGYNIVAGNTETILNNGTLTVTDSTSHLDESGAIVEGSFLNGASTIIKNNGTCTIEKGKYELTLGGTSSEYYKLIENAGTITLNGGTFNTNEKCSKVINSTFGNITVNGGTYSNTSSDKVMDISGGSLRLNGGTISGSDNVIYCSGTGTVDIKGGTITATSKVIYNDSENNICINGGNITGEVYNSTTGKINITNGNITGNVCNYAEGKVDISGGTVNGSGKIVVNNRASGEINITGGTIKGARCVVNNSIGTINVDGTQLSEESPIEIIGNSTYASDTIGIRNEGTGTINIKGHVKIDATYSDTSYGVYATSRGIINIGNQDEITNNVKIIAKKYGIYNFYDTTENKIFNYYGGTITAKEAVHNYIENIPDNYEIVVSMDENGNEMYEIGHTQEVALVGENKYDTLQEAVDNCTSGTIVLLKDIAVPKGRTITINSEKNITLDLNNHKVKILNSDNAIKNNGTLKLTDTSSEGNGLILGSAGTVIETKGNFYMLGGTIQVDQVPNDKVVYVTENGKVEVQGGTMSGSGKNTGNNYYLIYSDNSEEISVIGGSFILSGYSFVSTMASSTTYNYAIYTTNPAAKINITSGQFKENSTAGSSYGVCMNDGGTINILGNTYFETDYGVHIHGAGTVNISENVNLNTKSYAVYADSKGKSNIEVKVNVNDGIVNGVYSSSFNNGSSSCTINAKGGEITGTGIVASNTLEKNIANIYEGARINATSDIAITRIKEVNMYGGEVIGKNYGIEVSSQNNVNIFGGTVTGTSKAGILVTAGTLTLGKNEGGYPSQEIPLIKGNTYGVENKAGTFNFYDGVLTGTTYATSGEINDRPEMFSVLYSDNGTVAKLGVEPTVNQVAQINGINYNDFGTAMSDAIRINGTIELCRDIVISSTSGITIPTGSVVTIDLCGHSINGYTETGAIFTVNGMLIIEDTTDDGTNACVVRNNTGKAIINNGTLTIGTNDGTQYTNSPAIIGTTEAVENNGTFNLYDGKLEP